MMLPLTTLCQKSTPWHFGDTKKKAFQHLKTAFTMAPILCYWAPDLPMTVEMDDPDQAITAILSVTTPDQMHQPGIGPVPAAIHQLPARRSASTPPIIRSPLHQCPS